MALHFVGMKTTGQLHIAKIVFGEPDFYHRWWDARAKAEVQPGDTVLFAEGNAEKPVLRMHVYDDSAHF